MWGKGSTPALLVEVQNGTAPLEISMVISQKIRKQSSSKQSNTTFGYISKGCSIVPKEHVLNYVHSSIVIARTWKQPKCPSTKEWIRKMWYIYTVEYYTAENNNDILKFVDKWMDLENIILSEVIQTPKDKYHIYSLISGF